MLILNELYGENRYVVHHRMGVTAGKHVVETKGMSEKQNADV
jgi:hypothetical protein